MRFSAAKREALAFAKERKDGLGYLVFFHSGSFFVDSDFTCANELGASFVGEASPTLGFAVIDGRCDKCGHGFNPNDLLSGAWTCMLCVERDREYEMDAHLDYDCDERLL